MLGGAPQALCGACSCAWGGRFCRAVPQALQVVSSPSLSSVHAWHCQVMTARGAPKEASQGVPQTVQSASAAVLYSNVHAAHVQCRTPCQAASSSLLQQS